MIQSQPVGKGERERERERERDYIMLLFIKLACVLLHVHTTLSTGVGEAQSKVWRNPHATFTNDRDSSDLDEAMHIAKENTGEDDAYTDLLFPEDEDIDDDAFMDSSMLEHNQHDENKDLSQGKRFHMDDFHPSHVLSFVLEPAEQSCFFEDITKTRFESKKAIKVRGAYFTASGGADLAIDFQVQRQPNKPNAKPVTYFQETNKDEANFALKADQFGLYSFCFTNRNTIEKTVTFAIHVGSKVKKILPKHISPLEASTRQLAHTLADMRAEAKFLHLRIQRHIKTQDSIDWRVANYTIVESLILIGVTVAQVYYIKRLVNRRQWV